MDSLITFEKLTAQHLPYLYEIRFSVEENLLHPHQIQYLQRTQALEDINQAAAGSASMATTMPALASDCSSLNR